MHWHPSLQENHRSPIKVRESPFQFDRISTRNGIVFALITLRISTDRQGYAYRSICLPDLGRFNT
jgi:hypothetical protein